ncbi:MAG: potassium-transporting ATPase subunit KdpA, partial [Sphingomonas sp.]|nr:potassium-transporting ATPase subunit KdpA [Sphingomonas sp.]
MTLQGWTLILVFFAILIVIAKPMGLWLFALYEGRRTPLHAVLGPMERGFYRLSEIDPAEEMSWRRYAVHMLIFNVVLALFTYAILRLQAFLPLNAPGMANFTPDGATNVAVSFTTNTNWQNYSGEAAMSNLSQMLGLTIHNFTSAATGIALAFALFRGFARRQNADGKPATLGNFWADVTRVTLYLLLPISIVYALYLIASGVPQTLVQQIDATTLEGVKQTIALGPVASQEAIKMLGTNGGGFFNANSAHPFENPSALTDFVQIVSIFAIGVGLTWCFGKAVGNTRQGWAILSAMLLMVLAGVAVCYWQEAAGNPMLHQLGLAGGNMEGKEVRFGTAAS